MSWSLDRHTALSPGPGLTKTAHLAEELRGFGGIHGGHVAATALRAMQQAVTAQEHHPRTLNMTFVTATHPGPIELETDIGHAGKALTVASARLTQAGTPRALGTASFGATRPSLTRLDRRMPVVPPPEECEPLGTEPVPGSQGLQIAHRPAGPLPLSGSDDAHALVWMRMAEERPVDALAATTIADGAVPALFCAIDQYLAMPTIELAIHFAELEAAEESPWLLGSFVNVRAVDGWATEDGELWTPSGHLVLVARQLRRIAAAASNA